MPSERINHGHIWVHPAIPVEREPGGPKASAWFYDANEPVPEGATLIEDPSLDLAWMSSDEGNGWVQFVAELPVAWMEARLAEMRRTAELEDRPMSAATSIGFDVLDRPAMNRLVRIARRARNASYGGDE